MSSTRTHLLLASLLCGALALSPSRAQAKHSADTVRPVSEHSLATGATEARAHQPRPIASGSNELPPPSPTGEAPPADESASPLTVMLRMILVLLGVLLLAYLLLHKGLGSLSKKLSQGRLIRVVDRVGLEPKKSLYVVEVTGRYYLIGTTDHGVSCLATLDAGEAKQAFGQLLSRQQQATADPSTPAAQAEGEAHVQS